jgi:hypothetical protein
MFAFVLMYVAFRVYRRSYADGIEGPGRLQAAAVLWTSAES